MVRRVHKRDVCKSAMRKAKQRRRSLLSTIKQCTVLRGFGSSVSLYELFYALSSATNQQGRRSTKEVRDNFLAKLRESYACEWLKHDDMKLLGVKICTGVKFTESCEETIEQMEYGFFEISIGLQKTNTVMDICFHAHNGRIARVCVAKGHLHIYPRKFVLLYLWKGLTYSERTLACAATQGQTEESPKSESPKTYFPTSVWKRRNDKGILWTEIEWKPPRSSRQYNFGKCWL